MQDTHKNEVVKFTGSKSWTLVELAELITSTLKLDPPLQLKIVTREEYIASNDLDKELLQKWATTFPALKRGELAVVDPLLQEILGRELRSFDATVKEVLEATGDGGAAAMKRYNRLRK